MQRATKHVIGLVRAPGRALTGPQAAGLLLLLRMNDLGAAWRDCRPVPQPHDGRRFRAAAPVAAGLRRRT
jgi:hypothetical protein